MKTLMIDVLQCMNGSQMVIRMREISKFAKFSIFSMLLLSVTHDFLHLKSIVSDIHNNENEYLREIIIN